MARLNGTSGKNGYLFYADITERIPENYISTNKTIIDYKVYIQNQGVRFSSNGWTKRSVVDNEAVWVEDNVNITTTHKGYNEAVCIMSGSKEITHNADGSRTINFEAYIQKGSYGSYDPGRCYLNGQVQLTTIPRASKINSFTGNDIDGNFKVNYTSYYSGFTNKLRLSIPNVKTLETFNYTSDTVFTLSEATLEYLYNYTKNTNSVTLEAVIETYSGTTKIGESSALRNVCTINNANPIFNDFTYQDTNSSVTQITGTNQILVKGLSNLLVTISTDNKMSTLKGALPKNYISTIASKNISTDYLDEELNIDLGVINVSGTQRLNVRAYDTRNNSTLVYKDITIYDYNKPEIHATITRLNNFEDQTTLKIEGIYSKLIINDINKNNVEKVRYRYREENGSWNDWVELEVTIDDNKFSCDDTILLLDNSKAFEFEVEVIDKLSPNNLILPLDIGQSIFFISSNKKACYINGQEILTYDVIDEW